MLTFPTSSKSSTHGNTDFYYYYALQRPDVPIKAIEDLRTRWDWSKVKAELVPSIAGRHEGWSKVLLTGHGRLMRAVRNMGLRTGKGKGKNVSLECQVRARSPYMF